ncbi:MAG: sugar porter family MFS transporter [Thermoguttaceae bacterium]
MRTSSLVIRSSIIAALGGLLFGFDTAVISGTVESLKEVFQLSDWYLGFTVAIALLGTILGAGIIQFPSNRFGRKPTLIVLAILYFISAVGSAFPWDWSSFLFFRFLGGIAVGGSSVVSPLYTAEISPPKTRGVLVAITQFNIVFGILLAFFSNYIIANGFAPGSSWIGSEWRLMFGVEAIPALAFFLLLFLNPESPRWLLTKGRTEKAKNILLALGTPQSELQHELDVIEEAIREEQQKGLERFFCWRYRFPIFLAICMAAFNQLSGINAILYYAPKVFSLAGASKSMSMFFPVIIGLTNLLFTIAAMFVIDSFGRKKLMLFGSLGYILSLSTVAGAFILYGTEFNLSIRNIAREEAQQMVVEAQTAYETASESDKAFRQKEWETAKEQLDTAILAANAAAKKWAEKRSVNPEHVETNIFKSEEQSAVRPNTTFESGIVPMTGVLIVLGGLMLFIASHAFGQGACIWVFIGEIFPNRIRAQGQALGSFVHWILCAIISQLFPPMLALFGPAIIFLFFAGMMVLQLLWVLGLMPETKQVPLEEMQKRLGIE